MSEALAELMAKFPPGPVIDEIDRELVRVEQSEASGRSKIPERLFLLGQRIFVDPETSIATEGDVKQQISELSGISYPTVNRHVGVVREMAQAVTGQLMTNRFRPRNDLMYHASLQIFTDTLDDPKTTVDFIRNWADVYMTAVNPGAAIRAANIAHILGNPGARDQLLETQTTAMMKCLDVICKTQGYEITSEKQADLFGMIGSVDMHNSGRRFTRLGGDAILLAMTPYAHPRDYVGHKTILPS